MVNQTLIYFCLNYTLICTYLRREKILKYPFYFVTAFLSLFFSTRTGCKLAGGGDVAPPFRKFKASFLAYNKALHLISEVGAIHKLVIRMQGIIEVRHSRTRI